MDLILSLFQESLYIDLPVGVAGWSVWFALAGLAATLIVGFRSYAPARNSRLTFLFLLLLALTPLAVLFIGLRLSGTGILPPPGRPIPPVGPAVMLFAALPWVAAAGLLGPWPAAVLAGVSGLMLAGLDTHSPFTPLNQAILAVLLSAGLRQRYRTPAYRLWRRPSLAAPLLSLVFALLLLLTLPFAVSGTLASRLDYTLARIGWDALAMFLQLLVAGVLAEIIAFGLPSLWGGAGPLLPSPGERSLQTRLFNIFAPLALVFLLLLMFGMWQIAGNAASSTLEQRLRNTADTAAQGVPFFLETGQNLIAQLAEDPRLYLTQGTELETVLTQDLRSVPYFDQLAVLDSAGRVLGGFPLRDANAILLSPDEIQALELAFAGVQFQMYSLSPGAGDIAGRMSFLQAVRDNNGNVQVVLLGRTSLSTNPFTEPILDSLAAMQDIGGYGILLDEQGLIMYHPEPQLLGTGYAGAFGPEPVFAVQPGTDGTRQLVYSRPVPGRGWGVITSVPAREAQQTAMEIAAPVIGGVLALYLMTFLGLWLALRKLGGSLQELAAVSTTMAAGDLDHPLAVRGADEIGQLGQSFEQMRLSLKARLDELNRLLSVSQGVASSLDMARAVGPVLEAALTTGASAARLVLTPAALPEFTEETPSHYGLGASAARYEAIDDTLLAYTQRQPRVVLSDPARTRLNLPPDTAMPAALLAVALRHEDTHYGVLWAAYDAPHTFAEDEISFFSTVAAQAALAAANARLYLGAQLGRQRLEAILAATPDPVLVTDNRDRLVLANPAAAALLGGTPAPGIPLGQALPSHPELRQLLKPTAEPSEPVEITFLEDRVYYATASTITIEKRLMGRVCILRDITRYKELNTLKSEFVSNVSHDLRAPLQVMGGYANMLHMMGPLNDEQAKYVKMINTGIQTMLRLVNNLLDLGRIEAGVDLKLEMVPAADLARQVVEALRPQAVQKRIALGLTVPENTMPMVEADSALLYQAMQNLIENAIKYTEGEGRVDVTLAVTGEALQFAVRDTGLGIAPVDQPRLFERFYRVAARESRKQSGSGLGLAIVKSIIERHNGTVKVESRLGEGSLFSFNIPLRQEKT